MGIERIPIERRPAARAEWLTVVYMAVLLLATTIQAVHLCGLEIPSLRRTVQARAASFNGGACMTCLMAPSAATVAPVLVFSPTFRVNKNAAFPPVQTRQSLQSFQLYVRPPPAC